MKVGVTPWLPGDRTAAGMAQQAQQAESLGYHGFWLPESHFRSERNPHAIPDPLMLLAAAAATTRSIRLATTSYLLPLRHPLQAAEQVAVLDQLSSGRVTLGVGRGFAADMLRAFNVAPRDKRSLFEACLACMIEAWSGAPVRSPGMTDEQDGVVVDPLPVQQPHPPIWVAAFGPKALAQAGRLGLPYLASPVEPMDVLAQNYASHEAAARAAGVPVPVERPIMRALFVTEGAAETRQVRELLERRARGTGRVAAPSSAESWTIVGEPAYVAERVADYRQRLGMTHLIVARLGLPEMPADRVERSVARAIEVAGG